MEQNVLPLSWPSAKDVDARHFHQLKYVLRRRYNLQRGQHLLKAIEKEPKWRDLYIQHPTFFTPIFGSFVDSRLPAHKRFEYAQFDLSHAPAILGEALFNKLLSGESVCLGNINTELNMYMALNKVSPYEGFWCFYIADSAGRRIYNLTFNFRPNNGVIIGSLQGLANSAEYSAKDILKKYTKETFGLRPVNLLIEAFRFFCIHLHINGLKGINHYNHTKRPRLHKRNRLQFNYNTFWQELSNQVDSEGNWQIPLTVELPAREDIAVRKRAMYTRRFELLSVVRENIGQALTRINAI